MVLQETEKYLFLCECAVHVGGERVVVIVVLPFISKALIVRLLHRPLAPSDDGQAAVA